MQKTEKNPWLARFLKYAIYITAFMPLIIFSQYNSPFHFGKIVVFRSLIEVMAVFYLVLIINSRNYLPSFKNKIVAAFSLFTLLFGISTIFSTNPYLSFWGSLERMGGWWTFLHFWIYFLILTSVLRTKKDWLNLFKIMIFVGVLSAFYGFGQRTTSGLFIGSGGRERIFGTIGNPALFAGYQIVNLFVALTFALSSWISSKQKKYFYFAAAINTVAILMTAVRGSILAIAVGFVIFAILYAVKLKSLWAKRILLSLLGLCILFIIFAVSFKNSGLVKSSGYLSRITDFTFHTFTVETRFWAWDVGLHGWVNGSPKDNVSGIKTFLLGWGPENFNVPFSINFNPNFFQGPGSETLFDRAHNMFVEVLVTMGLLAFIAYVSIFVFAYRLIWRLAFKEQKIDKVIGIGLISLLSAYIVHNCFIFDTSANFLVFFTILGFVTALGSYNLGLSNNEEAVGPSEKVGKKLGGGLRALLFVLLIGAVVLIYETNILAAEANYTNTRAIVAGWNHDTQTAVEKYKESIAYNVPGIYEYRNGYAQYVMDLLSGKIIGENEAALLKDAITEEQKNADQTKDDYLPYLYLSRLNIILGKDDPKSPYNDEALRNSMKALAISPTFVRTYYEVAQAYLNKKDYGNAIKYFSKAVELNPNVGLSYWYLAATYFEKGDTAKGLDAATHARQDGYQMSENDLLRLINLYLKMGDFKTISGLYESLIQIKPDNPQYHASLAVAYAKIGRIDDAVKEAQTAEQIDPSFKHDADIFLQSLGR